jgi:hypothetical protein
MKRPHLLISGAWLLQAIAWFVPVVQGGVVLPDGLPGLEAFLMAASALMPHSETHFTSWYAAVLSAASAISTVLFIVASPLVVWRGWRWLRRASAWTAAIAFIVNIHWFVLFGSDRWDLRIGYYIWWLSFGLLALGLFDLAWSQVDQPSKKAAASTV